MSSDLSKAYELLGVKPGYSSSELKAAHRDLAKVWHPDRFLHDPRLQYKAQEKLKEINEAYELLNSGKSPRPAPSRSTRTVQPSVASRRSFNWRWFGVPLLVFMAVFALTMNTVLRRNQPEQSIQVEQPAEMDQKNSTPTVEKKSEISRKEVNPEVTPSVDLKTEPTVALETVTVTIDPESGLIAKQDCPLRSRMTYPRGSEPTAVCNLSHTPAPKDSRIKALATKLLPQRRRDAKGIQEAQ